MSSKRSSDGLDEGPAGKRRSTEVTSEAGSKSGRRRVELLAGEPAAKRKAIVADVSVGPPSLGEADKTRPLPKGLAFRWGEFARRRISVDELRSLPDPRPDVKRLLKVAAAVDDGAGRISGWLGRQAVFVVPAGLPCSVTFVRSVDEVAYIDAVARVCFVEKCVDEYETPLNVVSGFHRFPYEYHRDAASVKRWKAAAGVRRTLNVLIDERDWALVCQRGTDATVFNYWAQFVEGITVDDFAKVPEVLARYDVSAGVVVPLPWVCRFFASVFEESDDVAVREGAERWLRTEWAMLAIEAYGYELFERGTAWVLSSDALSFFEGFAKLFEPISVGAITMNDDKFDWTVIVETMGRAADQAGVARRWNDYCTNRSFGFVAFDVRSGEVGQVGAIGAGSRNVQGDDRGRPSRAVSGAGEFGAGLLHRVMSANDLAIVGGIDKALGVDVGKRGEHERRVGDILVDLVGVVARLRRQNEALNERVTSLEREVDDRNAEVRRLQSQGRFADAVRRPDPYAVADPYSQGGGHRWETYGRQPETRPDPYSREGGYRQADPYAQQVDYRPSGTYERQVEYRQADRGASQGAARGAERHQAAVPESTVDYGAGGVGPSGGAGPSNAGGGTRIEGDGAGFRQVRRRYPTLVGGGNGGAPKVRDGANPRQGAKGSGFGTELADGQ